MTTTCFGQAVPPPAPSTVSPAGGAGRSAAGPSPRDRLDRGRGLGPFSSASSLAALRTPTLTPASSSAPSSPAARAGVGADLAWRRPAEAYQNELFGRRWGPWAGGGDRDREAAAYASTEWSTDHESHDSPRSPAAPALRRLRSPEAAPFRSHGGVSADTFRRETLRSPSPTSPSSLATLNLGSPRAAGPAEPTTRARAMERRAASTEPDLERIARLQRRRAQLAAELRGGGGAEASTTMATMSSSAAAALVPERSEYGRALADAEHLVAAGRRRRRSVRRTPSETLRPSPNRISNSISRAALLRSTTEDFVGNGDADGVGAAAGSADSGAQTTLSCVNLDFDLLVKTLSPEPAPGLAAEERLPGVDFDGGGGLAAAALKYAAPPQDLAAEERPPGVDFDGGGGLAAAALKYAAPPQDLVAFPAAGNGDVDLGVDSGNVGRSQRVAEDVQEEEAGGPLSPGQAALVELKGGIWEAPTIPAVRASVVANPQAEGAEAVVVQAVDAKEATGAAAHEAYGMYWHGGLDLDSVELPE